MPGIITCNKRRGVWGQCSYKRRVSNKRRWRRGFWSPC